MIETTSIPIRNPDVLGRMAEDEAVLVMPQKGKVKVLNEVGAVIWESIDGERSVNQIIDQVCTQFSVTRETAEEDTLKFLNELAQRELITIAAG